MKTNYLVFTGIVLIFSVTLFIQFALGNQTDEVRFSITLQNQPLKTALYDIEKKAGFTIVVDDKIANTPVSGVFKNVTVDAFFSRALKGKNIAILTETDQNRITISNMQSSKNLKTKASTESANFERKSENFATSEGEYINQAKQTANTATENELKKLEFDRLTGKTWAETEQLMRPSGKKDSKNVQMSREDFLAAESDYIAEAKMRAKTTPNQEADTTNVDPLTGKNWNEIESPMQ